MTTQNTQGFPELEFFCRVESSFAAIASQHKLPHRRLLALGWTAKFHGISVGMFRQAFELWLESQGGDI